MFVGNVETCVLLIVVLVSGVFSCLEPRLNRREVVDTHHAITWRLIAILYHGRISLSYSSTNLRSTDKS